MKLKTFIAVIVIRTICIQYVDGSIFVINLYLYCIHFTEGGCKWGVRGTRHPPRCGDSGRQLIAFSTPHCFPWPRDLSRGVSGAIDVCCDVLRPLQAQEHIALLHHRGCARAEFDGAGEMGDNEGPIRLSNLGRMGPSNRAY